MENLDDIVLYYRRVFSTNEGKFVLSHMLYELGLFNSTGNTPNELKTYGARLLEIIGNGRVDLSSVAQLITQLTMQKTLGD